MISGKAGRLFVAAALAATFFLALPAEAADGRGGSPGFIEQLTAWVADGWDGWMRSVSLSMSGATGVNHEGGYLDPNGGPKGSPAPPPPGQNEGQP